MLVSAYQMLDPDQSYRDLGPDWLNKRHATHTRRLVAQPQSLGDTAVLNPAA